MRFGPKCEEGFLPVFSVGTMEEAEELLTLACRRDRINGEFIADELLEEQTLPRLYSFGDRLAELHAEHFAGTERCSCSG